MSQFAVFPNPKRDRQIAYVVQIQTNRFNHTKGRVVMTLIRRTATSPPDHPITPHLTVLGVPVFANPFDIVTVPLASSEKDTARRGRLVAFKVAALQGRYWPKADRAV